MNMRRAYIISFLPVLLLLTGCVTIQPPPVPVAVQSPEQFTGEYLRVTQVDKKPRDISKVAPVYPEAFRNNGIEGEAVVCFIVNVEGATEQVHVIRATDLQFAKSAIECVKQWRFTPAIKANQKVPCAMEIPITFLISQG